MNVLWLFFILVLFCIYILIGLHITDGIESFIQTLLTWVIYTLMCTTIFNVFLLGYFWAVVHNKRGPTGLRGPIGERGLLGIEGKCEIDLVEAYLIKELMQYIDDLYYAQKSRHILNQTSYTIPCTYVNNKIAVMSGSRQYKTIYKNLYVNYNPTLYETANFNTDTQQTDTKPIQSIISYLKNIWKQWFNLIYNATTVPGQWFNDPSPDADEDYKWSGANPFIEIRKYDVYYWGITRNFRPLKAEICRGNDYQNSKLPIINQALEPRLKIIRSNDYYKVGDSEKSPSNYWDLIWKNPNGNVETSWWCPNKVSVNSDTFYPVGDVMTIGKLDHKKKGNTVVGDIQYENKSDIDNGPDMKTILVSGDVVAPINQVQTVDIDTDHGTTLYRPVCPDGYTALGDFTKSEIHPRPSENNYRCVPTDCVEKVSDSIRSESQLPPVNVWNRYRYWWNHNAFKGSIGWKNYWKENANTLNDFKTNYEASEDKGYNLMRGGGSDPFYKIKEKCLTVPQKLIKTKTKPIEIQFEDLGIGWYGHPYKLEPKYSIFSFLNLAPEGLVVHSGTGRRYYVIHYGGEEADIYIFLTENSKTTENTAIMESETNYNTIYTKAIQTDSNTGSNRTNIRNISKQDTRQQWKIKLEPNDKKHFTMTNINNNKWLNIDLDPRLGFAVYTTIPKENVSVNNLFSFIPAFGTHLNNVE
jgi:hypothetical protein